MSGQSSNVTTERRYLSTFKSIKKSVCNMIKKGCILQVFNYIKKICPVFDKEGIV